VEGGPVKALRVLGGVTALAAGYLVAEYWRMRWVGGHADLPYHPVGLRATLSGPGRGGPVRYMALGDSTAHGIGASTPEHSATYRLAESLTTHYAPVTFANIAVSGATTADVLRSQIPQVADFAPDLVTLFIGPNDVTHFRSRTAYLADMERLLTALDAVPAVVVTNVAELGICPLLAPPYRLLASAQVRRFNAALPAVVARHRARLATINPDTVPRFQHNPALWAADGYHASDAGYQVWADYLAPKVAAALTDRPAD
jgi:acyl-CoA thioesterase-1